MSVTPGQKDPKHKRVPNPFGALSPNCELSGNLESIPPEGVGLHFKKFNPVTKHSVLVDLVLQLKVISHMMKSQKPLRCSDYL